MFGSFPKMVNDILVIIQTSNTIPNGCVSELKVSQSRRSGRRPVTAEITGSSPVETAKWYENE